MSLRYLLDTSVISSPVSREPDLQIVKQIEKHAHESAIGAPVWHELTYGCRRLPRGKRRTALEDYLGEVVQPTFPVLPYDEAAAAWHALERARLEGSGRTAPYVDGQIAAIAHTNGLKIVTLNTKDFERFRDLQVENWSRPARNEGESR